MTPAPARVILQYLDFESSDDGAGHGTFDAMASVPPSQFPALEAELVQVLEWAHGDFGPPAPLDAGGEWDAALSAQQEVSTALDVRFEGAARRLHLQPREPGATRIAITLTLSGTSAFCDAFRAAFGAP